MTSILLFQNLKPKFAPCPRLIPQSWRSSWTRESIWGSMVAVRYRSKYHTLIIAFILWKRYKCNNYCLRVYLSLCRWREPCVGSTHSWTSCSAMPLSSRRQEVKILLVSNGNNARGWCSTQYYIAGMIVVRGNSVVMLEARDRIWKQYQDIVCAFSPNICSVVIFHFVFVIVIFLVKPVTRYFQLQNDQMHCKISLQGISSY